MCVVTNLQCFYKRIHPSRADSVDFVCFFIIINTIWISKNNKLTKWTYSNVLLVEDFPTCRFVQIIYFNKNQTKSIVEHVQVDFWVRQKQEHNDCNQLKNYLNEEKMIKTNPRCFISHSLFPYLFYFCSVLISLILLFFL